MFFNRFKPEKAHEELKNWLLSLRSKYENVNGMSHLIADIDDEIENIDYLFESGCLSEDTVNKTRDYIDRMIEIYKERYSVPTEEQEDDYSNDETSNTVSTNYEPITSLSTSPDSSDVDSTDETVNSAVDDSVSSPAEKRTKKGRTKYSRYRFCLYVPTNITDLTSIQKMNIAIQKYEKIREEQNMSPFLKMNESYPINRYIGVELMEPIVLDDEGDARFDLLLRLERDLDKECLLEPELKYIISILEKNIPISYSISERDKYPYNFIYLEPNFKNLEENDFYFLRAYIKRAEKVLIY